jgi:integrator complex subunit 11
MEKSKALKILCGDELVQVLGMERHLVQYEPMVSSRIAAAG